MCDHTLLAVASKLPQNITKIIFEHHLCNFFLDAQYNSIEVFSYLASRGLCSNPAFGNIVRVPIGNDTERHYTGILLGFEPLNIARKGLVVQFAEHRGRFRTELYLDTSKLQLLRRPVHLGGGFSMTCRLKDLEKCNGLFMRIDYDILCNHHYPALVPLYKNSKEVEEMFKDVFLIA